MFNEKGVKEAFDRVKSDIFNLGSELLSIKNELLAIKSLLTSFDNDLNNLKLKQIASDNSNNYSQNSTNTPTHNPTNPTNIPTQTSTPTHNPTVPSEIGGLKSPFSGFSIGNRGVPTNQQTNRQTDNPTHFYEEKQPQEHPRTLNQHITDATEILNSLDNLRKEVRLKFKTITNQEMAVFSTIYELEQNYSEGIEYEQIAAKLKLSSSSIRDYVQRLINKGVPILKNKINNKKILLRISNELKKIATLDTIIKLREL